MRATLKDIQLVDCKSGHSPLLTTIHKFKYNIIKRTIIPYNIVIKPGPSLSAIEMAVSGSGAIQMCHDINISYISMFVIDISYYF